MRGKDFVAFNEQLAHLAKTGMPIEQGLRLVAQDMRSGRLASAVRDVADALERGQPLSEAFDARRGAFPALYGQLMDVGVQTGDLPGVLFNLGRHLDIVARLRTLVWRSAAYPLIVLFWAGMVAMFIGMYVAPPFEQIFADFDAELPALTEAFFATAHAMPWIGGAFLMLVIAVALRISMVGHGSSASSGWSLAVPLIGPVLRHNLSARWCDAVRIGVEAGLDLPRSIALAGDSMRSEPIIRDSQRLIDALNEGAQPSAARQMEVLPGTVQVAMGLGIEQNNLSAALETLSSMHQQQAEVRLGVTNAVLAPIFVVMMAALIGLMIMAVFMPMIALVENLS